MIYKKLHHGDKMNDGMHSESLENIHIDKFPLVGYFCKF